MAKITTEETVITPHIAAYWLQSNTFNRSISRKAVSKYATDMADGNWRLNHQGIAFDDKGVLVDGQHRLHAVIESGASVRMLVTYGADRTGIDELRPRSTADVIKFGGLSDWIGTKEVQIARAMLVAADGDKQISSSTSSIAKFADAHKDNIQATARMFRSNKRGLPASLRGAVAIALDTVPSDVVASFVEILYTGCPESRSDIAALKLREYAITHELSGRAAQIGMMKVTMRALKAFWDRHEIGSLRMPEGFIFTLK